MKKFLVALLLGIISLTTSAQVLSYRTTAFYSSENTAYGWTNWTSAQRSNMLMKIDWDNALVYIDSNYQQLYQILSIDAKYRDNEGNDVCQMRFVDQDGDRGTMKFVIRSYGTSQVYIIFNNVRWCYDIVRL